LRALESTFDEKTFLREMKGFQFKNDLHGIELLKAGLFMPVININGIHSGYQGAGTKTVLPRKAVAKVDIRFGPDLEPEEVAAKFERHLHDRGFDDIEVRGFPKPAR
jgi:acetylornithine deacetylase/succinyl-diaminopimelate desuccinylase-like protein